MLKSFITAWAKTMRYLCINDITVSHAYLSVYAPSYHGLRAISNNLYLQQEKYKSKLKCNNIKNPKRENNA